MDPLLSPPPLQQPEPPTGGHVLAARAHLCHAINLPVGGILYMDGNDPVTLTAPAAFRPACTMASQPGIVAGAITGDTNDLANLVSSAGIRIDETADAGPQFSDFLDPFYASTFPQCYALAATTVIAYTLVIMLCITPRSFLDGGVVVLGRRGFTNGGAGGTNIGGRPWLQKVAALTVAISLTIATADTFREAERQYSYGIQNAPLLQQLVLGGTELKVIRLISDTFLWLAQAQTLIRLFPRQREKVIIKWTAFSLITLDLIFDSLNSFIYTTPGKTFTDAVPALSYLFQLSLGVLYAAWVIYYAIMKKRYAFYHPRMRNICLVAVLSLISILVPVVFFILDISKPDVTGWGDYVRWVGAAAASVIVWEWVERIEALEREEKKDGILGREVFDGDDMMEVTSSEFTWPRKRKNRKGKDEENGTSSTGRSSNWPTISFASRYRSRSGSRPKKQQQQQQQQQQQNHNQPASGARDAEVRETERPRARFLQPPLWPARPQPAATPVSRTDTASADSTVYAVRYHQQLTDSASRTTEQPTPQPPLSRSNSSASSSQGQHQAAPATTTAAAAAAATDSTVASPRHETTPSAKRWRVLAQAMPFRRKDDKDDKDDDDDAATAVTAAAAAGASSSTRGAESKPSRHFDMQHEQTSRWDFRARFEDFAVSQAEKIREKIRPTIDTANLPVMVIPAPARRGAALAQVLEEEEARLASTSSEVPRNHSDASGYYGTSRSAEADGRHGSSSPEPPPTAPELWRSRSDSSRSGHALSPSHTAAAAPARAVEEVVPGSGLDHEAIPQPSQVALDKRPAASSTDDAAGGGGGGAS